PSVLNFIYIVSFKEKESLAGTAKDRPMLSGSEIELDGNPTTSWVCPSGVYPDKDATAVRMLSMPGSPVRDGEDDLAYVAARGLPADALEQLWGFVLVDYTDPHRSSWGRTIAHELGHVLGLRHRGNGATDFPPASDDCVNDPHGKGHPWRENVMCYGGDLSLDFDLIQTKCIRKHPLTRSFPSIPRMPSPPLVPPPPKEPGVTHPHVATLQVALGDLPADGIY